MNPCAHLSFTSELTDLVEDSYESVLRARHGYLLVPGYPEGQEVYVSHMPFVECSFSVRVLRPNSANELFIFHLVLFLHRLSFCQTRGLLKLRCHARTKRCDVLSRFDLRSQTFLPSYGGSIRDNRTGTGENVPRLEKWVEMGKIREFMETHYLHFNARTTVEAARAYEEHLEAGGKMLVSLAGAMSTGELGIILARMIRSGKVHAISCTGANLEEDVFNLVAHNDYEIIENWRNLPEEAEGALYERGMNRVTDTCIPEDVMRHLEDRLVSRWAAACETGERWFPAEYLYQLFESGELEPFYQIDRSRSWLLAAYEMGVPVYSPGWEDSTCGNIFAAAVMSGKVPHHQCVKTGTEQFQHLMEWYQANNGAGENLPSVGFFQIGGGIAGDFAICAVPCIIQDLRTDTPFWGYFAQITDAEPSYGGYSGAIPSEKITWGKLDVKGPKFVINSDATIVAPLIFAYLLGD